MRPYTAPDFDVRPSLNGYVVRRTDYLIDRWGDKTQETEDVAWRATFAEADALRVEYHANARKRS